LRSGKKAHARKRKIEKGKKGGGREDQELNARVDGKKASERRGKGRSVQLQSGKGGIRKKRTFENNQEDRIGGRGGREKTR